jgi:hypothetical protein
MTWSEKKGRPKQKHLCIKFASSSYRMVKDMRAWGEEEQQGKPERDLPTPEDDQKKLDELVLRMTPNVEVSKEGHSSMYISVPLGAPIPESTIFEKGADFQKHAVSLPFYHCLHRIPRY